MSNYQNNAFRPKPAAPDLTRAPQHVRDAANVTVPTREGEVTARVVTMKRMLNVPNARVHISKILDVSEKRELYSVQMLDYRGLEPLAHVEMTPEAFQAFAERVASLYKGNSSE